MHKKYIIVVALLLLGCDNRKERLAERIDFMQMNLDSAENVYAQVIKDYHGHNLDSASLLKYTKKAQVFRATFKGCFDSLTSEYMNQNVSQSEYDLIIASLKMDSVNYKYQLLKSMGVDMPLK